MKIKIYMDRIVDKIGINIEDIAISEAFEAVIEDNNIRKGIAYYALDPENPRVAELVVITESGETVDLDNAEIELVFDD